MEGTPLSGQSKTTWARALRPLLWCGLLVLILLGIRTHQRLSRQTSLTFSVSMQGQPVGYGATAKLDDRPFDSGQQVSIGGHRLVVTHPKAEPFATNLFIWYGPHNFGDIALKRAQGNLSVTVTPPADWLIIRGPEWSVTLRNSSGTNTLVPADTYEVEADFPHWREKGQAIVGASFSSPLHIAPRFGILQLECNQPDASYQLLDVSGQDVSSGSLPATITELPKGSYTIVGTHRGNRREYPLFVVFNVTNTAHMDFQYGSAILETTPSGATVKDGNGRQWGKTPLTVPELLSGDWNFTLQQYGYAPVQVTLAVAAGQTNVVSTNLVGFEYINAMNAARQYLTESNYYRAGIAVNQALQTSPLDQAAIALQQKITALSAIQNAESWGAQSNYTAGIKLLQSVLQLEPDNERAKGLLAGYQKSEPEQLKREKQLARLNAPKQAFDAALGQKQYAWSDFYKALYFTTGKTAHDIGPAINNALTNGSSPWTVTLFEFPLPDIFVVEANQHYFGGMRKCLIIGGQAKDDETQIFAKVLEYESNHTIVMQNLFSIKDNVQYALIDPNAYPDPSDIRQGRIRDGVQIISERIQRAIGQ